MTSEKRVEEIVEEFASMFKGDKDWFMKFDHQGRALTDWLRTTLTQDRAALRTSLVAAVEGKKRPVSADDLAVNDIHEVYKDGYNTALDDTLTIINSIFKE